MTQKIYVEHLRIGMYVAELDRPWSDAPFEPPFELQAFTLQTNEEIAKVQALCEFVLIDPHKSGMATEEALAEDTPASASKSAGSASGSLPQREGSFRITYREQKYEAGEARPEPEPADPFAAPVVPGIEVEEIVEPVRSAPKYVDTVTVEEEMAAARQVLTDTEAVFERVAENLKSGQPLDADAIKRNVENLVESVIRNPDALSLLTRLKQQDGYTYSHSMAVCVLALTMGRYLGLPPEALQSLGMGTLLQDVGKLSIPSEVLQKHEELDQHEKYTISQHVDLSMNLLRDTSDFPSNALDIVKHHHERYDGSGYPHGLKGDEISPYSVIAGIADTYEAMTNLRPYRPALNSYEALGELYGLRDRLFPTAMVENLIQCVGIFPVGSFVELDTFQIGIIVGRNQVQQMRPRVMIVLQQNGERLLTMPTVDLSRQDNDDPDAPRKILRVVDPAEFDLNPGDFFV